MILHAHVTLGQRRLHGQIEANGHEYHHDDQGSRSRGRAR